MLIKQACVLPDFFDIYMVDNTTRQQRAFQSDSFGQWLYQSPLNNAWEGYQSEQPFGFPRNTPIAYTIVFRGTGHSIEIYQPDVDPEHNYYVYYSTNEPSGTPFGIHPCCVHKEPRTVFNLWVLAVDLWLNSDENGAIPPVPSVRDNSEWGKIEVVNLPVYHLPSRRVRPISIVTGNAYFYRPIEGERNGFVPLRVNAFIEGWVHRSLLPNSI